MNAEGIEVSVVLPCLNEAGTVGGCVRAAIAALDGAGIAGEVVVADNGSSDGSREIALDAGARIVEVRRLGYGSALATGMAQAQGDLLVFLDADMSYDFADIPRFVEELRRGAEVVIGSRLRGGIDPGAMPALHRILGTPAMTKLANVLFHCGISDINCGMRGLTRAAFDQLDLHSEGMEFASEMMIKAAQARLRIVEIPIQFHADQRDRAPHLRSFHDGWRHLQLMLHFCSLWLFAIPGLLFMAGGLAAIFSDLPWPGGLPVYLAALVATMFGTFILLLGLIAQGRVRASKYAPKRHTWPYRLMITWIRIENGMALGAASILAGIILAVGLVPRDASAQDIRFAFLAAVLVVCGLEVFFTSLFMGLFGIRVADEPSRKLDD